MDALAVLEAPTENQIHLIIAPHAGNQMMLALSARLAIKGVVRVLDGGNQYDAFAVAREIRRQTVELDEALINIRVSRGFTCYQMQALISETSAVPDRPVMILNLLSTYYDESVALRESIWMLDSTLTHLRRLSERAPVIVSARPPFVQSANRLILLDQLRTCADKVLVFEEHKSILQPTLF
jgi:hypothetical protein